MFFSLCKGTSSLCGRSLKQFENFENCTFFINNQFKLSFHFQHKRFWLIRLKHEMNCVRLIFCPPMFNYHIILLKNPIIILIIAVSYLSLHAFLTLEVQISVSCHTDSQKKVIDVIGNHKSCESRWWMDHLWPFVGEKPSIKSFWPPQVCCVHTKVVS